ncbi:hypothetical protein F4824DRAFT_473410 [Ustulina deusta]|nr:hypothetical protein F4824DRAFT_473410 [Ustulina deusta]
MHHHQEHLQNRARLLLSGLLSRESPRSSLQFRTTIYDTAWLSMVKAPPEGNGESWLFPQCFNYIIKHQCSDGSWSAASSTVNNILDTAASLLAVRKHLKENPNDQQLVGQAVKAEDALHQLVTGWEAHGHEHVVHELLIMKHIILLEEGGVASSIFDVPYFKGLRSLNLATVSQLLSSTVYDHPPEWLIFLEAFIGDVDFNYVKRWRWPNGSIVGSPAATAAYLMYTLTWDYKAEEYLRAVTKPSCGHLSEGLMYACPALLFEANWIFTNLSRAAVISSGPQATELCIPLRQDIEADSNHVLALMTKSGGNMGFSTSLPLLGNIVELEAPEASWATARHFREYQRAMVNSFTANCDLISCWLELDDPSPCLTHIMKALDIVCSRFLLGQLEDKSIHRAYQTMLLARTFSLLCDRCAGHDLLFDAVFHETSPFRCKLPLSCLQLLHEVLPGQERDRSWAGACESTAYAILTLLFLEQLPWIRKFSDNHIQHAIERGRNFLMAYQNRWGQGHCLWADDTTFTSAMVRESYCLTAAWLTTTPIYLKSPSSCFNGSHVSRSLRGAKSLIALTPLISELQPVSLDIAESQAYYLLESVLQKNLEIFPNVPSISDKYLAIVPLIWTTCNTFPDATTQDLSILYEMSLLSILVYQTDHYVEFAVERSLGHQFFHTIQKSVKELFVSYHPSPVNEDTMPDIILSNVDTPGGPEVQELQGVLSRLLRYMLDHPAVKRSSSQLQARLASELETFLLAHLTHAIDNHRFRMQHSLPLGACGKAPVTPEKTQNSEANKNVSKTRDPGCAIEALEFSRPNRSFYSWVRSTSSDHSSCPFAFVFFQCLLSNLDSPSLERSGSKTESVFEVNVRTAYLAEDVTRHLACLCRMYNDYGSLTRDIAEGNLNSVNFPEFHMSRRSLPNDPAQTTQRMKSELMWVAEYERRCLERAVLELGQQMEETVGNSKASKVMRALKLFINVTDLFGQVYVQKDMTASIQ